MFFWKEETTMWIGGLSLESIVAICDAEIQPNIDFVSNFDFLVLNYKSAEAMSESIIL